MPARTRHITVILPDDKPADVSYYCSDSLIKEADRTLYTKLYIQLHDCLCTYEIEKELWNNRNRLEVFIHNKVINAKGHLCD